ncbi:putative nicotinate/nicotinamide nucleotide adenylyltransferase [Plasmopara halstedii]
MRRISYKMPLEVLLFGLSANPPTGQRGHMGIVQHCRNLYDEIWLMPVYQHIYSSKRQLAPFEHRVEMCRLALETLRAQNDGGAKLKVIEEERNMYEDSVSMSGIPKKLQLGSIDLVHYLRNKYRNTNFTMLLGGDTYLDLLAGKWKRGDELRKLVKLLVVDRKGVDSTWRDQNVAEDCVTYIHVPQLDDVSSTIARNTTDYAEAAKYLDPVVLDYIVQHKLYAFATDSG